MGESPVAMAAVRHRWSLEQADWMATSLSPVRCFDLQVSFVVWMASLAHSLASLSPVRCFDLVASIEQTLPVSFVVWVASLAPQEGRFDSEASTRP